MIALKNLAAVQLVILFLFFNLQVGAQKITFENGVKIIENGSDGIWGNNPKIKLEYEGKFGNDNEKDKNTMFKTPVDIAFDKDANIYVLDAGECTVRKFDKNKKYLSSLGRKGKGPGEMIYPANMDIDPQGNIYVFDFGNYRMNIYSPQGKSIGNVVLKYSNYDFKVLNDGKFIVTNPNLNGGRGLKENNVPLFIITNQKGDKLKEFGQGYYFTHKIYKTGGNRLNYTIDRNSNIYAAFLFQNKIDKYDKDGKLIFRIKRKPSVNKKLPEGKDMYSTLNKGIAVDSKDRIWLAAARRNEYNDERIYETMYSSPSSGVTSVKEGKGLSVVNTDLYAIELFDKDGQLLYKFPVKHFVSGMKLFNNKLYVWESDRELTFHIYKISDL